ncbi:MAG: putative metal-dependent hydrolase [Saprospiraceae bacterium]
MTTSTHDPMRFPTGPFKIRHDYSKNEVDENISSIKSFPLELRATLKDLPDHNLNKPYRPDGWTGIQVIHHIADSHMNAYIRIKWALTEEVPTIKTYKEKEWAVTPEMEKTPISVSIGLLENLHARWSILLENLDEKHFKRSVFHPEMKKEINIAQFIALYAWHGRHHIGHLKLLK